jgi:DNA-binding transcriptional regulator YiaG
MQPKSVIISASPPKTGAELAERRREKGLTQADLAKLLSVSIRTIKNWEGAAIMGRSQAIACNAVLEGRLA